MLHAIVTVIGPGPARDAAAREVLGAGGAATDDGARLILAIAEGVPGLEALSRRCPRVTFAIEAFEELESELTRLVIVDGAATELSRNPLLDDALFGPGLDDEDADCLDSSELQRAGRMIIYREPPAPPSEDSPLAVGLAVAKQLGRFAERAAGWQDDDAPAIGTLQAVADLGAAAADLCIGCEHASPAEREHHRAMTLTRAVLHAGREPVVEGPWDEWLGDLLADGARITQAAYEAGRCEEDGCRCHELLGLAAIPLLTLCIQTLATFQPAGAAAR